jgi:hypothetical protein
MHSISFAADTMAINKFLNFEFPTAKIPDNVPTTNPALPPPLHSGFFIISRCNDALAQGKTIHDKHSFDAVSPSPLASTPTSALE